jgi:hypothetical protein
MNARHDQIILIAIPQSNITPSWGRQALYLKKPDLLEASARAIFFFHVRFPQARI